MAPSSSRAGPSTFARLAPGCRRRSTSRQPFPSRNGEPSEPTAVEGDEDVLEHHLEEIYDENQDDRRYVDAAEIGHEATDRPERRLRHPPERSEEHTSELQSLMRISYAVFCLKKKKSKLLNP